MKIYDNISYSEFINSHLNKNEPCLLRNFVN